MNEERRRRETFSPWPNDPSSRELIERLASAGFFATGNGTETQCNWCGIKINDWNHGDHVDEKHRHYSPDCAFVVNPGDCDNVIESTSDMETETVETSQTETDNFDLMNEQCRLTTFTNWPVPFISPQILAKAGFYYINESDRVRCVWCNGIIAKWEIGDDPFTEHLKFFPDCSRAQLGPNVELRSVEPIQQLGIQPLKVPKNETYSSLDARVRSFGNWPSTDVQSPETLASAGFYYQNQEDQVMCFQCDGGLRAWQREDDPWFEHARWFPKCEFVQLAKGAHYIEQVQNAQKPSLDDAMSNGIVQEALALGFSEADIKIVMKHQLEHFSRPFRCAEELIHAVLEYSESRNGDKQATRSTEQSTSIEMMPSTSAESRTSKTNRTESSTGEATAGLGASSGNDGKEKKKLSLEEENRQLKDAKLCKVCMDEDMTVVFLPCGHLGNFYRFNSIETEVLTIFFHCSYMCTVCAKRFDMPTVSTIDQSIRANIFFMNFSRITKMTKVIIDSFSNLIVQVHCIL